MTNAEALDLAKKFKVLLQKKNIPFSSIFIFGSVARNEQHEDSDIDIAVIGASFKGDRMKEMLEIRKLRRPISYKIQPIWMYPEQLNNEYSTLSQQIKMDSIEV